MQSKVDEYFSEVKNWNTELSLLRQFVLDCQLQKLSNGEFPVIPLKKRIFL